MSDSTESMRLQPTHREMAETIMSLEVVASLQRVYPHIFNDGGVAARDYWDENLEAIFKVCASLSLFHHVGFNELVFDPKTQPPVLVDVLSRLQSEFETLISARINRVLLDMVDHMAAASVCYLRAVTERKVLDEELVLFDSRIVAGVAISPMHPSQRRAHLDRIVKTHYEQSAREFVVQIAQHVFQADITSQRLLDAMTKDALPISVGDILHILLYMRTLQNRKLSKRMNLIHVLSFQWNVYIRHLYAPELELNIEKQFKRLFKHDPVIHFPSAITLDESLVRRRGVKRVQATDDSGLEIEDIVRSFKRQKCVMAIPIVRCTSPTPSTVKEVEASDVSRDSMPTLETSDSQTLQLLCTEDDSFIKDLPASDSVSNPFKESPDATTPSAATVPPPTEQASPSFDSIALCETRVLKYEEDEESALQKELNRINSQASDCMLPSIAEEVVLNARELSPFHFVFHNTPGLVPVAQPSFEIPPFMLDSYEQ